MFKLNSSGEWLLWGHWKYWYKNHLTRYFVAKGMECGQTQSSFFQYNPPMWWLIMKPIIKIKITQISLTFKWPWRLHAISYITYSLLLVDSLASIILSSIYTAYPSLQHCKYFTCEKKVCVHLSPCFKLMNFIGNLWRHAHPKIAVSSSALNLLLLLRALPATKLLQSWTRIHTCNVTK